MQPRTRCTKLLTDLNDQPMQRYLFRFCVVIVALFSVHFVNAQEPDTTKPTSVDPRLLEWEEAKTPKEAEEMQKKFLGEIKKFLSK